jgi:gamma-glutamyltranspeptidase / glutathione hydrolase
VTGAAPLPVPGRSVVATCHGVVAASQPLAAMAGVQVLHRGGNAIDAAIATNAAMGVMEPTGNGVGGDLFALVHDAASGRLYGLNASGWSPAGLTVDALRGQGLETMPDLGVHSVTVAGTVAGWDALRDRFGRLSFDDLLAPAIHYAESGFPVAPITAGLWARSRDLLAADPDAAATFLIDGRPPAPGQIFRNPALARTLGRIAEQGRAGFYEGDTADAMVAVCRARGGALSHTDLADLHAEWATPIATRYRGWTVHQIGPQTQGIAALMMLDIMERFPLAEMGFHSADALHVMIEAKKLAYADMIAQVGDPRFGAIPVSAMLDPAHTARQARRIDMDRAADDVRPARLHGVTDRPGSETIFLSTADRHGNMVALIQSNYVGFGSGLVPAGTGFMLQNRGALFTMQPGHPNVLEPRKRPLHTIIPGFMEKDDTRIAFGIMGGWNQAQAHAQFVANVVDFGMDIQQALEAGRFTKSTFEGRDVDMETLVPADTRQQLGERGHLIAAHPPRTSTFGFGQAVMAARGVHYGASDPRHDGGAIPEGPPEDDMPFPSM